jgi:two-component system CheB/CheR fusion protein
VFVLLRTRTGNDFSCYKTSTVNRRIERRMGVHQFNRLERYGRGNGTHPGNGLTGASGANAAKEIIHELG